MSEPAPRPLRLKVIGCEVLARALYARAARSPHVIDISLVPYGLHQRPAELRARLQALIDAAGACDAVLLAYGLCGKSTDGLQARQSPLVIPRAHDCITLFLGSRERYNQQFAQHPGTYWYVQDYLERDDGSGAGLAIGAETGAAAEALYQAYVQKYGLDNADYLMEVMGAWKSHYDRAAYIELDAGDGSATRAQAQSDAARRGWRFEALAGDLALIRRLLDGDWQAGDDFLVVPPGGALQMTYDERILACRLPGL